MIRGHVDEFYTAYLENTLPQSLRQEVEEHLRVCPQCSMELAEFCQVVEYLHEMPTVASPQDFSVVVRSALPVTSTRRAPCWTLTYQAMAVACVLLVVGLGLRYFPHSRPEATARLVAKSTRTGSQESRNGTPRLEVAAAPASGDVKTNHLEKLAAKPAQRLRRTDTGVDGHTLRGVNADDGYDRKVGKTTVPSERDTPPVLATAPRESREAAPSSAPAVPAPMVASVSAGAMAEIDQSANESAPMRAADGMAASRTAKSVLQNNDTAPPVAFQLNAAQTVQFTGLAVEANAIALPGETSGQVHLTVRSDDATKLRVTGASSKWVTEQHFNFDPPGSAVTLSIPSGGSGANFKLTFSRGAESDVAYLFAPGEGPRQQHVTLRATNQSMIQVMQQLANDAGLYIFAPAEVVQRTVTMSLKLPPAQLINTVASQQRALPVQSGQLVTITPQ